LFTAPITIQHNVRKADQSCYQEPERRACSLSRFAKSACHLTF